MHGVEKITAWRGRKNFLATQKNMAFITESPYSNKILQICKNNSIFILLKQNNAISLQRNSTKQPLAVSHWRSSEIQTKNKTLNTMHRSNPPNVKYDTQNKASDKTLSRRRIAADFQVRGNKREEEMASVKTRNGNVSEDLKVHRY